MLLSLARYTIKPLLMLVHMGFLDCAKLMYRKRQTQVQSTHVPIIWPIRPANEMYNAKLSISFVSEPERKALSFLTSPKRFLSDHCLHLLSLCAAFSLLTMALTCLFLPLPLVFGV